MTGHANRLVVICDDEAELRETIGEYLDKRGFRTALAADAAELEAIFGAGDIAAIILDINMPGEDGLSVLRRLRATREVAVIMLTAAGGLIDRIVGLELGADDYLVKPVDFRELEARLRAVLRRTAEVRSIAPIPVTPTASAKPPFTFAGSVLDRERGTLQGPDGNDIPLTPMEFRLLLVFVEHAGRVLNRDQLLELAHDRGWDPFDRSIDIRISRLRRKIEPNPAKPSFIRTIRGLGYLFDPSGGGEPGDNN